jgi:hypothetical protein
MTFQDFLRHVGRYFAGAGGLFPLCLVSVVVCCVVVPSGVETDVFFVADDLSEHPIVPTAITPITKTALMMRFIVHSLS